MRPDVIAIGASAGGVQALQIVVKSLPSDLPAAVLIVQHLSPQSPGYLPRILQNATALRVCEPAEGDKIARGCIYVAPPNRHLLVADGGEIRLGRGPKENRARPAVDPLFRSAALAFDSRLIGVILTGYLYDGAAGLQAVKLCGGIAIVQDPSDAVAPSMPSAALASAPIDHCLPLAQIGPHLVKLVSTDLPKAKSAPEVRERLAIEADIAVGRPHPFEIVQNLGQPSRLTCPECQGVLLRVKDSNPERFRCHTGHAFSQMALRAGVEEIRENAGWAVVPALQEEAMLLQHLARHAREAGDAFAAEGMEKQAQCALDAAVQVRGVFERLENG